MTCELPKHGPKLRHLQWSSATAIPRDVIYWLASLSPIPWWGHSKNIAVTLCSTWWNVPHSSKVADGSVFIWGYVAIAPEWLQLDETQDCALLWHPECRAPQRLLSIQQFNLLCNFYTVSQALIQEGSVFLFDKSFSLSTKKKIGEQ